MKATNNNMFDISFNDDDRANCDDRFTDSRYTMIYSGSSESVMAKVSRNIAYDQKSGRWFYRLGYQGSQWNRDFEAILEGDLLEDCHIKEVLRKECFRESYSDLSRNDEHSPDIIQSSLFILTEHDNGMESSIRISIPNLTQNALRTMQEVIREWHRTGCFYLTHFPGLQITQTDWHISGPYISDSEPEDNEDD